MDSSFEDEQDNIDNKSNAVKTGLIIFMINEKFELLRLIKF